MEEPRLCMEPRATRVIGDPNGATRQLCEGLDRGDLGSAREDRRKKTKACTFTARKRLQRIVDRSHTTDGNKRDDRVDAVCGRDLSSKLMSECRLLAVAR